MADSSLQPVSVAVFGLLNVSSLKGTVASGGAGCLGGITDSPPQAPTFPFLFYEVEEEDLSGLGAGSDVKRVELRLHVFSVTQSMVESQRIMREAIRLLQFTEPSVTGWRMVKVGRPRDVVPLPFEELNGVKVRELVSLWSLFVSEV